MTTRGLRVGDVAGVGGAICDEFCSTAMGSGRGRKRERENMVAVEPKSEGEALSVALFLHNSLLLIQYRPVRSGAPFAYIHLRNFSAIFSREGLLSHST